MIFEEILDRVLDDVLLEARLIDISGTYMPSKRVISDKYLVLFFPVGKTQAEDGRRLAWYSDDEYKVGQVCSNREVRVKAKGVPSKKYPDTINIQQDSVFINGKDYSVRFGTKLNLPLPTRRPQYPAPLSQRPDPKQDSPPPQVKPTEAEPEATLPVEPAQEPVQETTTRLVPMDRSKFKRINLNIYGHELRQELSDEFIQGTGLTISLDEVALPTRRRQLGLGVSPQDREEPSPEPEEQEVERTTKPIDDTHIRKILNGIYSIPEGIECQAIVNDEDEIIGIQVGDEQVPLADIDTWVTKKFGVPTLLDKNWLQEMGAAYEEIIDSDDVEPPQPVPFFPSYYAIKSKGRNNSVLLVSTTPHNIILLVKEQITLHDIDTNEMSEHHWSMAIPMFLDDPARYVGEEVLRQTAGARGVVRPKLALRRYLVDTKQGWPIARHAEATLPVLRAYARGRTENDELVQLMNRNNRFRQHFNSPSDLEILESVAMELIASIIN